VTPQKTNASEPLTRCRNRIVAAIETRLNRRVWDKVGEAPVFCLDGGRHRGGVSWERGDCAERGNLALRCQGRIARGHKTPSSERVPMLSAGTDPPIVARKSAKAGGAKGRTCPAKGIGQLVRGGADA
jgi:hypothetical protein